MDFEEYDWVYMPANKSKIVDGLVLHSQQARRDGSEDEAILYETIARSLIKRYGKTEEEVVADNRRTYIEEYGMTPEEHWAQMESQYAREDDQSGFLSRFRRSRRR